MRTRAFSLIEVLISIVVLALGLLGIAAVFPAVVTQQRTTTDSVHGASLQESVRQYITANRVLNRPSVALQADGTVDRADLRGWQLLVDNPSWSRPLDPDSELFDGEFEVPGNDITQAGISTDVTTGPTTGMTWILNADATQPSTQPPALALLNEPVAWIPVTERQLPVWPNGRATINAGPVTVQRPDALYVWDFAARRVAAGSPYFPTQQLAPRTRALQDDQVQVAVFIRRKDKPLPRATDPMPVGEDNNGRPTFDGTGQYSLIRSETYTVPNYPSASGAGTNVLNFTVTANGRYIAQVGQKLVDQWGDVHEVVKVREPYSDTNVTVEIRATTQRSDEGVKVGNVKAYQDAGVPLRMIFTNQIPVSVSVFNVRPQPNPRS